VFPSEFDFKNLVFSLIGETNTAAHFEAPNLAALAQGGI